MADTMSLTDQMINDYIPFIKEEYIDRFVADQNKAIKENGPIIRIEEIPWGDGSGIAEKRYYHKNGLYISLDACRAGVETL